MTVNRLAIPDEQHRTPRTAAEWLWPLLPIGLAMFCGSALVYYHLFHDEVGVTSVLQRAIAALYATVGFAPALLLCLLVLTWSSIWFVTGAIERPAGRVLKLLAMTVMLSVFMNLGDGGVATAFHKGALGAWLAERLVAAFGYYPSLVLVWLVTFGALLLATDFFFSEGFERLRTPQASPDTGVEAAVTDHLKGLAGAATAVSGGLPRANQSGVRVAGEPVAGESVAGESVAGWSAAAAPPAEPEDGDVEVEPAVDPLHEPVAPVSRRRSYFERRYVPREEPAAAEAWLPGAGDGQEIDNPETFAEASAAALPADPRAEPNAAADDGSGAPTGDPTGDPTGEPMAGAATAADAAASPPEPPADAASARGPDPAAEPIVTIPRAEPRELDRRDPAAAAALVVPPPRDENRQQSLFADLPDEDLVEEARVLVVESRRASAALLQRKLRIGYDEARALLAELAARGVVELEADQAQGRVIGG